jgi:hypothetical protein
MLIATMLLFNYFVSLSICLVGIPQGWVGAFFSWATALSQPHTYTKTKGRTFYPRQGGLKLISFKLA